MILILTLGFDVKFQLRALTGRAKELEKVVIVGEFKNEKAKNALDIIVNFLNTVNLPYEVIEVDIHDLQDIVTKVAKYILSNAGKNFIVNLSGGMRLMGIAVLAVFLLTGIDAEIEVETEDFATTYKFRVKDIMSLSKPLTKDHIEVLKAINEGLSSASSISKKNGIPTTSVWRRLKELRREGLIDSSNRLTNKGRLLVGIYVHHKQVSERFVP